MKGNYVEANHLFEDAVTKYRQMMNDNTADDGDVSCSCVDSSSPTTTSTSTSSANNGGEEDGDVTNDDDYDDDNDEMSVDVPSSSSSSSSASHNFQDRRICRMTSFSQLLSFSYCGRSSSSSSSNSEEARTTQDQQDRHQHSYRHEVYSLPIVMNEEEWELSSIEDKSFVLIYNTAVCNHLWGMQLLVSIQDNQQKKTTNQEQEEEKQKDQSKLCERAFYVAHKLYRLALENVITFVSGVDQLCYVAMFNNISHVCKTIQGYDSQEGYQFDLLLLKAIFWWKDTSGVCSSSSTTTSSSSSSSSDSSSTTATAATATATAAIIATRSHYDDVNIMRSNPNSNSSSNNSSSSNLNNSRTNNYADNDIDIIDSFLENVFYLIGAHCDASPAQAA
jgi:hypothetical protein